MTKAQLIAANIRETPDVSRAFLAAKTIPELRERLARWQAINGTTAAEIRKHCNVNFIR